MGIVVKQTRYEPLPVGEYVAKVGEVREEEGRFGPQLKLSFVLDEQGRKLTGWCSKAFSPKSKLYAWTRAIFGGRDIPPTWDFHSDAILNRLVRLTVVVAQGQEGEYNKIVELKPARPGDALPTALAVQEPEPALPEAQEKPLPF